MHADHLNFQSPNESLNGKSTHTDDNFSDEERYAFISLFSYILLFICLAATHSVDDVIYVLNFMQL